MRSRNLLCSLEIAEELDAPLEQFATIAQDFEAVSTTRAYESRWYDASRVGIENRTNLDFRLSTLQKKLSDIGRP